MTIEKSVFGATRNGQEVYLFTITNSKGNYVKILNYGCIIHSIAIRDNNNQIVDVVMGFDSVEAYDDAGGFVGALVGRCANRINGGTFKLNGKVHKLYQNEGDNHLHGGKEGFSKKVFETETHENQLILSYLSADGEESYPGNLKLRVIYTWTEEDELICTYETCCDQDTLVNLTNHSYFDLNGIGSGKALEQQLQIQAKYITPLNDKGHLTGEIRSVEGTCMDFLVPVVIKEKWNSTDLQIQYGNGYDHNYVLEEEHAAILYGEQTGIRMMLYTTTPGLQFYSGNYLRERSGKEGIQYGKHTGICLEPQYFPNSVNFRHFPSPIQRKNCVYTMRTVYAFKTNMRRQ